METFVCAGPAWFEREVETFIKQELVAELPSRGRASGILLFKSGGELLAVGAHQRQAVRDPESAASEVVVTYLRVAAVSLTRQGTRLSDGTPLASLVLRVLQTDGLQQHDRDPVVAGYIAADNRRARALCRREGFVEDPTHEMLPSKYAGHAVEYVWVSVVFSR